MNYFEQELRRIAGACGNIVNPTFAGRACYGDLGGDNRVKLEFVTQGTMDNYEALKATVLNRSDGEVDALIFRFADTWGKKKVDNKNFREGLIPKIWTYDGKSEWYVYRPTDADIKQLAAEIGAYLSVFKSRNAAHEKSKPEKASLIEPLRETNKTAAAKGDKQKKNKTEPDL
jgi:hypothetical protein